MLCQRPSCGLTCTDDDDYYDDDDDDDDADDDCDSDGGDSKDVKTEVKFNNYTFV